MCELCDGTFERIETLEVARAAFFGQEIDDFGAFHIVVSDLNVSDDHISSCLAHEDCTEMERTFGTLLLELNEEERISAIAKAQGLWGVESIH